MRVLLVATATRWIGPMRMPRALARAGFEVLLLAPQGSLVEKSRFLARTEHLPDHATPAQWLAAFVDVVSATSPRLVLPCDDVAFRLLQMVVQLPPPQGIALGSHLQAAALVRESLGDPDHYRVSVDKTLLPATAQALGVRVPPHAPVGDPAAAKDFADAHGYPIVLKRAYGSAGEGVVICADRAELSAALTTLTGQAAIDFEGDSRAGILVQAFIPGRVTYYSGAAWRGSVLTGYASDKIVAFPEPMGPTSVMRYRRAQDLRDASEKLIGGFGMSGMFTIEFMIHDQSREAYLLEINRRFPPGAHRGAILKIDLCAAMFAVLHGSPSPSRSALDPDEEGVRVNFPLEWLRDPHSHWLREYPVDVPWDEPELIAAMLALRHER